jgi:hypothetical protein
MGRWTKALSDEYAGLEVTAQANMMRRESEWWLAYALTLEATSRNRRLVTAVEQGSGGADPASGARCRSARFGCVRYCGACQRCRRDTGGFTACFGLQPIYCCPVLQVMIKADK